MQDFSPILQYFKSEISKLDDNLSMRRSFLLHFIKIRKALNEFEYQLVRYNKAFKNKLIGLSFFQNTEMQLQKLQVKVMDIEFEVHRNSNLQTLGLHYNTYFNWKHTDQSWEFIESTINSYEKNKKKQEITFNVLGYFDSEKSSDYLKFQVCLSRVLPLWDKLLMNKDGKQVIIGYKQTEIFKKAAQTLHKNGIHERKSPMRFIVQAFDWLRSFGGGEKEGVMEETQTILEYDDSKYIDFRFNDTRRIVDFMQCEDNEELYSSQNDDTKMSKSHELLEEGKGYHNYQRQRTFDERQDKQRFFHQSKLQTSNGGMMEQNGQKI
eukprot:403357966